MAERTVRVTRTWEFKVDAEYGDTYDSLRSKVTEDMLDGTPPDHESRVVIEEHASEYQTNAMLRCPTCTPDKPCAFHKRTPKKLKEG